MTVFGRLGAAVVTFQPKVFSAVDESVLPQTCQTVLQGDGGAETREGPGRPFFLLLNESGWMWGINLLSCQRRSIVKV